MSFVRLRKNKKAILSFFLVVMATFVFAYAYFKLGGSIGVVTQLVGEKEFILVQQYEKGEAVKLYLDLSSRAVMGKSLFLFEYDGHYSACGKNGLYYLWKSEDKECYPTEQSISSGLSTVFVKLFNPYIKNYKEFPLPQLSSADISFDLAEKKLISYPFSSINISSDPLYLINPSFVVQCDSDFDYDQIKKLIADVINKCSTEQDLNVVDRKKLSECVGKFVSEFNRQRNGTQIELGCGDDSKLDLYVEQYQLCAESLDQNCYCVIDKTVDRNLLDKGEIDKINQFDLLIQQKNKQLISAGETSILKQCRLNDRVFKFCADRNKNVLVDGKNEKIKTRFALFIDDKSAPDPIFLLTDMKLKKYKFVPSVSPDVSHYRVYIGKKGLPLDYSHYVRLERVVNIGETIYFDRDPDQYDIEVVAVDFKGNCFYQGQASTC